MQIMELGIIALDVAELQHCFTKFLSLSYMSFSVWNNCNSVKVT